MNNIFEESLLRELDNLILGPNTQHYQTSIRRYLTFLLNETSYPRLSISVFIKTASDVVDFPVSRRIYVIVSQVLV